MTKYVYLGKDLYPLIEEVRDIVLEPSLDSWIRASKLDVLSMSRLFSAVLEKLKDSETLYFDEDDSVHILQNNWKAFTESLDSHDRFKRRKFVLLWMQTEDALNKILSGVNLGGEDSQNIVRKRAAKDVHEDIQSLDKTRNDILSQIEQEESRGDATDEETLRSLRESLDDVQQQIEQKQKEQEEVKVEEQTESNWDKRIAEAFDILKGCTVSIEEEKDKAASEYQFYNTALVVIVILVFILMCFLYHALFSQRIYFTDWKSFLPYYLPVPVLIALSWVLIVQKNRANKLSITMSEELFRVRYLEGLLLAVNKLSRNSDASIIRINKAIDSMVESYLHQSERNFLNEDKISAIEKKELSTNKLMQWMDKLIDKV